MGKIGQGRKAWPSGPQSRVGWLPGSLCPPYLEQVPHSLRKAHGMHGHTHSVGKGENEANGAS